VNSASATLPRPAAPSGRLRGVLFSDAGDGRWPDIDTIGDPVAFTDSGSLAIVIRVGDPVGKPLDLDFTLTVANGRDSRGERRAEPDAGSRSGARRGGGSPRS
jgi:hypothetical protein